MTMVRFGQWTPLQCPDGSFGGSLLSTLAVTIDADEEELQWLGRVYLASGSGSKTFGTSSKIGWMTGAITFADDGTDDPTFRVGVKQSSSWDDASGPPARATIGAAAFDVYHDLVGGTDTISANAWRTDTMSAGTGFTVNHGDRIAVCFHLNKPGAAAQSVQVRGVGVDVVPNFPVGTFVTTGPTFTAQTRLANVILTFDDGSIGWIDGGFVTSVSNATAEAIGDTNLYGNIFRLPYACRVDAVGLALVNAGTTNFDVGLWSDPLGTPAAIANGTVSVDPQNLGLGTNAFAVFQLPSEITISRNTDYALAVKQNSATDISVQRYDVDDAAYFQANGLDSNTYAAKSTAGAAFAAENSGKRRMVAFLRISHVEDGVTADGGGRAIYQLGA